MAKILTLNSLYDHPPSFIINELNVNSAIADPTHDQKVAVPNDAKAVYNVRGCESRELQRMKVVSSVSSAMAFSRCLRGRRSTGQSR